MIRSATSVLQRPIVMAWKTVVEVILTGKGMGLLKQLRAAGERERASAEFPQRDSAGGNN
jgi:hypothetical protein